MVGNAEQGVNQKSIIVYIPKPRSGSALPHRIGLP